MLKWLLIALLIGVFFVARWGLELLAYGKRGMEAREKLGFSSKGLATLFALALVCDIFFGAFYFGLTPADELRIGYILLFAIVPVGIIIWIICARIKVPAFLQGAANLDNPELQAVLEPIPEGGWRCTCGKAHAAYVSSCVCGVNKRDIPKN